MRPRWPNVMLWMKNPAFFGNMPSCWISCVLRYHLEGSGAGVWLELVMFISLVSKRHFQLFFNQLFFNCFVPDGSCARLFLPPPWTQEKVTCRMGGVFCGQCELSIHHFLFHQNTVFRWRDPLGQVWCHDYSPALPQHCQLKNHIISW